MSASVIAPVEAQTPTDRQAGIKKATLAQFVLHEHTLLGLCFAKSGAPPVAVGCCCCIFADELSVRHRLFVFVFATVSSVYVALQVTVGVHSDWWAFCAALLVVMPSTCFLKSTLRGFSARLQRAVPCVHKFLYVRVEELVLLGAVGALGCWACQRRALKALEFAIYSLGAQMVSEFGSLIFKYFCCAVCCPCCVPLSEDMDVNLLNSWILTDGSASGALTVEIPRPTEEPHLTSDEAQAER